MLLTPFCTIHPALLVPSADGVKDEESENETAKVQVDRPRVGEGDTAYFPLHLKSLRS